MAQIVEAAGLPASDSFSPAPAHALARIDQMPIEIQQQLVRAVTRRYASTAPPRRQLARPAPAAQPPGPASGRSR
ncbi:hypothetical protein [Streptomyces celluloflavus]|uniref:hypothetical protein n=1 Tax=Streptomyces celluloflavus TaxID=58344 RepID=UPI0034611D16|nr:hypothetical protein OG717_29950 [Streptomyces celluloflavus]